jgi:hypothetical protein
LAINGADNHLRNNRAKAFMTSLEIMADYFQIYVCDPAHIEDWSALWTDQTVDNRIVALPHTVVFGTGRNMTVPIDIVVHGQQPDLRQP